MNLCYSPGCTSGSSSPDSTVVRGEQAEDRELNATPRILHIFGEFYAVGCLTLPEPVKN